MNYQTKIQRSKSGKQPVKFYTGEDLAKLASSMGLVVSPNHKPQQPKPPKKEKIEYVEIEVDDLPEHLKKFV
jgi:hypothetical protein